MILQGEYRRKGTGVNKVSLGFLTLSFSKLICPVRVNLYYRVATSKEEASKRESIISSRLNPNNEVFSIWGEFFKREEEFVKSLTINSNRENPGIGIKSEVADTSLMLVFTNVDTYVISSRFWPP